MNFFKILFVLLFCISQYVMNAQEVISEDSCRKFHTGKFTYTEVPGTYSVRNVNEQVSYYKEGWYTTFNIKWLTDCKFILTFVKASSPEMKTFAVGDTMEISIDKIDGECYTFTGTFHGKKFPSTQMCKVKE